MQRIFNPGDRVIIIPCGRRPEDWKKFWWKFATIKRKANEREETFFYPEVQKPIYWISVDEIGEAYASWPALRKLPPPNDEYFKREANFDKMEDVVDRFLAIKGI